MIAILFLAVCLIFVVAYSVYGRFLERRLDVDDSRSTPAVETPDGVDYVATPAPILFGHHFSSIAGAGPIVGPILAGLAFGWAPVVAWIVIGAIFVGGVHDFTAIVVSIRQGGRSIADICRNLFNPLTYRLLLVFILFTLTYVIIVFLDLTAAGFAPLKTPATDAVGEEILLQGGATASAALLYIALAIAFGLAVSRFRVNWRLASLVVVPLVFSGLWIGLRFPLTADLLPAWFETPRQTWTALLLGYCLAASILPVWILLQPRDYLSSFLLYGCLAGGVAGLLLAGAQGSAPLAFDAFLGWHDPKLGRLFPALFVTVACGAVSGFHSIVASGTTAKQLARERDARPIGYGGMLVEGVLAMLAIGAVMVLKPGEASGEPTRLFAAGLARFMEAWGLPQSVGIAFGMLAVSTFLLTTLDTCTRLARMIAQELTGAGNGFVARCISTLAVLIVPAWVVFQEIPAPDGSFMPAWKAFWPAFGATNQLMAALALLVVTAWLRRRGKPLWFVAGPAAFMSVTTLTALVQLIRLNLFGKGSAFVGWASLGLSILAVLVLVNALWMMSKRREYRKGKKLELRRE